MSRIDGKVIVIVELIVVDAVFPDIGAELHKYRCDPISCLCVVGFFIAGIGVEQGRKVLHSRRTCIELNVVQRTFRVIGSGIAQIGRDVAR